MDEAKRKERPRDLSAILDNFEDIKLVLPPLPKDRPNAKLSHKRFNEVSRHNLLTLAERCLALYDLSQEQQDQIDKLEEQVKDLTSKEAKKDEDSNL